MVPEGGVAVPEPLPPEIFVCVFHCPQVVSNPFATAAINALRAGCNAFWFCLRMAGSAALPMAASRLAAVIPESPELVPPANANATIDPPDQGPGVPPGLAGGAGATQAQLPPLAVNVAE